MEYPIKSLMDSTMDNIKAMVDVDTIVGDSIKCDDGTIIIPVSSVSFGFGAGGSDFAPKAGSAITEKMFGGGCGGGANVKPTGFLIVSNGNVRYLPISSGATTVDKVVDLMPGIIDKINRAITSRKSKKKDSGNEEETVILD